ncbi:unnamed protein product, partial [Brassica rapa subsp. trilocularis]
MWIIWKSRNEFLFSHRNVHPIEDALRAQAANREWWANKDTLYAPVPSVSSSQWEPPPSGWLKCNFDC